MVRVIALHAGRLLTPTARGKSYLLPCTIKSSHQTPACTLVLAREVEPTVDFHMMLIAYVHVHLVLERNRRHIPMRLTTFCCGCVYLLLRAVLSSHRTRMGSLASPCLASWTVERITLPAHPDRHDIGGFSPCTQVWRGLAAVMAAHASLAVSAVPTPPS